MSPRRLRGWEPAQVTEYEYDDTGRLIRSVTVREPEFTPDQVGLLLASHEAETLVDENGVPLRDALNPENQFRFKAKTVTNWAAKAIGDADDALNKQYPDGNANGRRWTVELG